MPANSIATSSSIAPPPSRAFVARATEEADRRGRGVVDEVEHHRLARVAATAGTVVLTNDGVLPLSENTDIGIIGAFADHPAISGRREFAGRADTPRRRPTPCRGTLHRHVSGTPSGTTP